MVEEIQWDDCAAGRRPTPPDSVLERDARERDNHKRLMETIHRSAEELRRSVNP